ncbi:ABC transporter substrate-binding protein [Clostridium sp.]|uniref:ABC transporter substrate-binding protein n=1 Tax=Clostridium sp. TaxID=1506 RepID=UPI002605ECED|nr:ABC transporter substrate-binding protein [Clostridium sp.]
MKGLNKIAAFFSIFIIIFSFVGCSDKAKSASTNSTLAGNDRKLDIFIIDMGGRKVELPEKIEKVYGANPMSTILLFTLVPDKIIGWNSEMPNKDCLPEKYSRLPVVGSIGSKQKAASLEAILTYNPDIIIFAQTEINEQAINKADDLSKQLGKPVVLVNGSFESSENTYEFLGKIFNCSERCKVLIQYYKKTLAKIEEVKSKIKDEDKISIYYGKEENALTTSGNKSVHAKLIDMVGGVNAASSVEGDNDAVISIENVIKWQPDIILLSEANNNEKNSFNKVNNSEQWEGIKAIKNNKIYVSPQLIFSWFDRPPSINELIGIEWLAETLYPDYYNLNIKDEIKDFYKVFYNIDLTDEQINKILS